jgi:hypothetical protein
VAIGDVVDILALAGAVTAGTDRRREAGEAMVLQAAEVTDHQAEEATAPLLVVTEARCGADEHRLRRAIKDLKARMTEGLRPLARTVQVLMAPGEHLLVRLLLRT